MTSSQQPHQFNFMQYCPHREQLKFHAGMSIYSQRAVLCGTGAGKTLAGLYEDIRWARDYPGSVGYIFGPTYPMIRRNIFQTLESPLLLGTPYPFTNSPLIKSCSRQQMRIDWRNESEWWFVSLESPERAEGANIDYAHIDEGRLVLPHPHFDLAWKTIIRRLRGSGRCRIPLKPGVWITTTPDAPGTPLFNAVENPKTKSPNCQIYRWSIYDNPKLPKEYVEEIVRTHTGGLAERFVYGRFAAAGVGTLLFDSTLNVAELSLANIREIRYGIDFGWTNPTAIVALAYDGDGRAWAMDEVYMRYLSAEQIIGELRQLQEKYGRGEVYCDRSEPETIFKLVHAGFNAKGYAEKREDGLRELAGRLLKQLDGKPRLFISKKCVNLISELMEYDEKVKENDHAVDALRYSLKIKTSSVDAFRFG